MSDNQMLIGQYDNSGWLIWASIVVFVGLIYVVYPPFTFWVDCKVEQIKNLMK